MAGERTLLIKPSGLDQIPSAVTELCSDLQVGGIVVGSEIARQLFFEQFEHLAAGIPIKTPTVKRVSVAGTFDTDLSWHLARQSEAPTLRIWQHHKGSIYFLISRALPEHDFSGYFYKEVSVISCSYATPAEFKPEPGEALVFVDKGCWPVTGTGSIHRTELRGACWYNTRLSSATDIYFGSSE